MAREIEILEDLRDGIETFVERWAKIQRNSVKSIQAVTNRIVQLEHLEGSLGNLETFQDLREKTKGKLLVDLFDKLVPALESSIKEFTKLMKMFESLRQNMQSIQTFAESLRGSIDKDEQLDDFVGFLDLIIMSIHDILNMFEAEFLVKITIYQDLEEGTVDLGVITNYLTIWTVEPNIAPQALDKLLRDLDEHFELLRDIFAGKTGVSIPENIRKVSF